MRAVLRMERIVLHMEVLQPVKAGVHLGRHVQQRRHLSHQRFQAAWWRTEAEAHVNEPVVRMKQISQG